jgi:hypothetical protein
MERHKADADSSPGGGTGLEGLLDEYQQHLEENDVF